jgi:hypothetical protein
VAVLFLLLLTLKSLEVFLKIFHVFIFLLKSKNLKNEYAFDIVKGWRSFLLNKKSFKKISKFFYQIFLKTPKKYYK